MSAALQRPSLLAAPGFVRLWIAGGIGNAMLWLEVLAAALFTLQVTGSSLAVAVVSAARAAPLLVVGVLLGAVSDAVDRRRIVVGGLVLGCATSASVALLAGLGVVRPWHLGVAALVSGLVYATEMPARRRMIAESAGPAGQGRATATDSLTNFATRVAGPLLGGWAYGAVGVAGAFALSAVLSLVSAVLVAGIAPQPPQGLRPIAWRHVLHDMRDGVAFARTQPAVLVLLGVTVTMNLCGYSYTALIAPIGRLVFGLGPAMVGVLAAAEPAGALLAGIVLTVRPLRAARLVWLAGGAATLLLALAVAAWVGRMPNAFWPVCFVLFLGGMGVATYTVTQTTTVLEHTPPRLRSRVMGLVSTAIGCWPLGILLGGVLTQWLDLLSALSALALLGLVMLSGVLLLARRR